MSKKTISDPTVKTNKYTAKNEKAKRQYAILVNLTGNVALSKQARYWGIIRIYKELNIYLPAHSKKSTLKPMTKSYKSRLLKSADNKYNYAIQQGVDPDNAEILKFQTYKNIDLQLKYNLFFKTKYKRLNTTEKRKREDEWSCWSKEDNYPPLMVHEARKLNLHLNLDINASYGFGIIYYSFIQNKSPEAIMKQYPLDRPTEMLEYGVVGKKH